MSAREALTAPLPNPYTDPAGYTNALADYALAAQDVSSTHPQAADADAAYAREVAAAAEAAAEAIPYVTTVQGAPATRGDVNAMAQNFADQIFRTEILDKDPFENKPENIKYAAIERAAIGQVLRTVPASGPRDLARTLVQYGYSPLRAAWAAEHYVDWSTPSGAAPPVPAPAYPPAGAPTAAAREAVPAPPPPAAPAAPAAPTPPPPQPHRSRSGAQKQQWSAGAAQEAWAMSQKLGGAAPPPAAATAAAAAPPAAFAAETHTAGAPTGFRGAAQEAFAIASSASARATEIPPPAGNPLEPPNGNMPVDAAMAPPPPDMLSPGGLGGMPPGAGGGAPPGAPEPDPLASIPDPLSEDPDDGGGDEAALLDAMEAILGVLQSHPEAPPEVLQAVEQIQQATAVEDIELVLGQAASGASPEAQPIFDEMLSAIGGAGSLDGDTEPIPENSMILPEDDGLLDDPAVMSGGPGEPPADTDLPDDGNVEDNIRRSLGESDGTTQFSVAGLEKLLADDCPWCPDAMTRALEEGDSTMSRVPQRAANVTPPGTAGSRSRMTAVPPTRGKKKKRKKKQ